MVTWKKSQHVDEITDNVYMDFVCTNVSQMSVIVTYLNMRFLCNNTLTILKTDVVCYFVSM